MGIYCGCARVDRKTLLKLSRHAESASGINGGKYRNNFLLSCDNRPCVRPLFPDATLLRGGGAEIRDKSRKSLVPSASEVSQDLETLLGNVQVRRPVSRVLSPPVKAMDG